MWGRRSRGCRCRGGSDLPRAPLQLRQARRIDRPDLQDSAICGRIQLGRQVSKSSRLNGQAHGPLSRSLGTIHGTPASHATPPPAHRAASRRPSELNQTRGRNSLLIGRASIIGGRSVNTSCHVAVSHNSTNSEPSAANRRPSGLTLRPSLTPPMSDVRGSPPSPHRRR